MLATLDSYFTVSEESRLPPADTHMSLDRWCVQLSVHEEVFPKGEGMAFLISFRLLEQQCSCPSRIPCPDFSNGALPSRVLVTHKSGSHLDCLSSREVDKTDMGYSGWALLTFSFENSFFLRTWSTYKVPEFKGFHRRDRTLTQIMVHMKKSVPSEESSRFLSWMLSPEALARNLLCTTVPNSSCVFCSPS